jgi:hypothetical protein
VPDRAARSGAEPPETEIKITPEMIESGANVIICEVGGADLGGFFSARDLAERVFRAMKSVQDGKAPNRGISKNP